TRSFAAGRHGRRRRRHRPHPGAGWPRFRPGHDVLEDRTLLSTLTVTNTNDSGPRPFRAKIQEAAPLDTIDFAPTVCATPHTITLASGDLTLPPFLAITGPAANLLTVSGNHASRAFDNQSGIVVLSGLTIANGSTGPTSDGGGREEKVLGTF